MTDYNRISKELRSLGWAPEQSRGDHVIFRKKGRDSIVVSMQVSNASRAYKNCLADIRSKEPDFTLGKPIKKKEAIAPAVEMTVVPPVKENAPAPAAKKDYDKTFLREHRWIKKGTRVVLKDGTHTVYTVKEIESDDMERVLEETDILHILPDSGKCCQVFPGDIDSALQRKCIACGQYRPMNWFGSWYKTEEKQNTCKECLRPQPINNTEMTEPKKTIEMKKGDDFGTPPIEEYLKDISSQQLYDELIRRGFKIQDNKFQRIIVETLE